MAQSPVPNPAAAAVESYSDKDVALTKDWLTIRGESYSVANIKKVEIDEYYSWQSFTASGCLVIAIFVYFYYPNILVIIISNFKVKLLHLVGLGFMGFSLWSSIEPARMILHLTDRKVRVLERDRSNLKKLKTKIDDARKASNFADKASRTS